MSTKSLDRDSLIVDPFIVERATAEARRLGRIFNADTFDQKEIYRTLVSMAVESVIKHS